jgi:hypothetical protein
MLPLEVHYLPLFISLTVLHFFWIFCLFRRHFVIQNPFHYWRRQTAASQLLVSEYYIHVEMERTGDNQLQSITRNYPGTELEGLENHEKSKL